MIPALRPPLLRRLPPAAWVAACWLLLILLRCCQRSDELRQLTRFDGNLEDAPLLLAAVVSTLAALLLRAVPAGAVAVALAGAMLALRLPVREAPVVFFLLADLLVGYTAATRDRRVSVPTALLPLAVLAGYAARRPDGAGVFTALALAGTVALAWLVGHTQRLGRAHAEALRARTARQAVTDERLRIARELHDMVAHSIGIIAIQAGVGSRVMETQPQEARAALQAVEATSRETLAGLRRMLGALREADGERAPVGPAPGLADLDALVERAGEAGVRVELVRDGEPRELPAELELAAFRIVQEAVTNVVRHSGTARCRVTVGYRAEELSVEIVDPGRGGPVAGPGTDAGYGIAGMRERVGLLHGRFSAGPRPGGGFRVAAELPLPAAVRG
ncbi:sensor histidine kinase [Kitasatospora sp. NPDC006697]|uniref:sensor histidine kinase n=1 Tax=Kitasatospora sp. NPDC006697 TaxID=3364020 RepID=UPI0036D1C649